ncbi:MAG: MOSC domain-containing protein [Pseudomonadota bacterium]|nr:MOSC domain-containing protein [Pseudomonadota bacterium]
MSFPVGLTIGPIFIGKAVTRWSGRPPSAILKQQAEGRIWLTKVGLRGDEQADLSVHGGVEKALHHYCADHYRFWRKKMPDSAGKFAPGGFGENVSTAGLSEEQLCIGDVIHLGEALVQISQGRQPCWKLSAHTGRQEMAAEFQKSGRTGWYYRVLQEGYIETGAPVALAERPRPEWPLPVVIAARFDPKLDPARARQLSMIEELSASWREGFMRKSDTAFVEDATPRLAGK